MFVRPALSIASGTLHVGVAATGSIEVTTFPRLSTTTQSDAEGHETPDRLTLSICFGALHVGFAAAGSVEITTSPRLSTATHSEVEGHETP
jgi:hypothetical protein